MNIPKLLIRFFEKFEKPRYRDRRAHYASSALSDLRDLYWELTGVPVTNPPDFKQSITMSIGNWVEQGLIKDVIGNLHFFGLHLAGTQIPVGGSNPAWNGYLDALVCERIGDKMQQPVVVEIKTAHGYGADLLHRTLEVKEGYLAQLGLYLKDLHEKGITNEGVLLYVLLSDKSFGEVVTVRVRYDVGTNTAIAYEGQRLDGTVQVLDQRLALSPILARFKKLSQYVEEKKEPAADYQYKRDLTPEFLAEQSDNALKQAANGEKILGDWQPRYSRYFNRILEVDKVKREYTPSEIALIRAEIERRKPIKAAEAKAKRQAKKLAAVGSAADDEFADSVGDDE
jgi:hypothetical protein